MSFRAATAPLKRAKFPACPRSARVSRRHLHRTTAVLSEAQAEPQHAAGAGKANADATSDLSYPEFVKLNWFENAFLAVGSAVMSLANPYRGDMIAALGETTAGPSLPRLRDIMLESEEGRQILKDRPRVSSSTVDMNQLATYPEGSLGRAYVTWLERCGVTPDTREPVRYIEDPELAYVMQRYRESHDFYHCITNLPVSVEYEIALKYFEFANLGLPMTAISALFGPLRLPSEKRARLMNEFIPWALKCGEGAQSLISVYWEKRWGQDVDELRRELGIWVAPEARWSKPLTVAKEAAAKRATFMGVD